MSTDKNKFSLERETSKFMNSSQILQAKLREKRRKLFKGRSYTKRGISIHTWKHRYNSTKVTNSRSVKHLRLGHLSRSKSAKAMLMVRLGVRRSFGTWRQMSMGFSKTSRLWL